VTYYVTYTKLQERHGRGLFQLDHDSGYVKFRYGDFFMESMELSTSRAPVSVKFHTQNSRYLKKKFLIFTNFKKF